MAEDSEAPRRVLGLLTDPDPRATAGLVHRIADELPVAASQRFPDGFPWRVRVATERIARGPRGRHGAVDRAAQRMQAEGWDAVVVIVDTPFRSGEHHTLVAETTTKRRVGMLSLAGMGGRHVRRRALHVLAEVTAVISAADSTSGPAGGRDGRTRLPGRIYRTEPESGAAADARFVVDRGWPRLLSGMVYSSYPWRLPLALTGSFVAALAFGMFWALSPTIWQLAAELDWFRLAVLSLAAVTGKVAWYVVYHQLWERAPPAEEREEGEEAGLFNASTVLNLTVAVGCTYVTLVLLLTAAAVLIIDSNVLTVNVQQSTGAVVYLQIAWLAASLGEIAGALGTKLDSDEAVRQVAYSAREHARPYAPESSQTALPSESTSED